MSDTTVQLGPFTFGRFEVPEEINFGGEQKLAVHVLVGGVRIIDALGEEPAALEWSGHFVGSQALDRALFLDSLRKAGQSLSFTWSEFDYTVVIRRLDCLFRRRYRIPYRISCEVVSDNTQPIAQQVDPDAQQLIGSDIIGATGYAGIIGDSSLSSLMDGFSSAVSSVGTMTLAAPSALSALMLPLDAVRQRIGTLIDANDVAIDSVAGVGGILPGDLLPDQVSRLAGQIEAVNEQPSLVSMDRLLGRVATNIGAINSGTKSLTVAGGNLYAIAADEYDDPMGWTALAIANGLHDPLLTGINTLSIPPFSPDTGGILSG